MIFNMIAICPEEIKDVLVGELRGIGAKEIDPQFKHDYDIVLSVLAHEICHKYLHINNLKLFIIINFFRAKIQIVLNYGQL